jgi:murein DD-endopeptidase MepM/ murein hydrolase activator NlpD
MEQKNESMLVGSNPPAENTPDKKMQTDPSPKQGLWERIQHLGLEPAVMRSLTLLATVAMMALVVWLMSRYYVSVQGQRAADVKAVSATQALPSDSEMIFAQAAEPAAEIDAIRRDLNLDTVLPMRARTEIVNYIVQAGDNLFSIAERFNLQTETVLWSNRYVLGDDPHFIYPGQELLISPVDGTLHRWSAGEGLNGVAEFYKVTPDEIINYPGNHLSLATLGDYASPNITPGTMLVVPGGKGEFTDWRTPRITREEPATAVNVGPGACTGSYDGVVGTLNFRWPVAGRTLSGYDYAPSANHLGIDLGGEMGDPVNAVDNGVVVYAGWNDWGYGNMVAVDHGFGWQSLYAHLAEVDVICGQEVYAGDKLGSMGDTGEADGVHLHFELRSDEYGRVNPWDFLQ